jgi:hypothetical protein
LDGETGKQLTQLAITSSVFEPFPVRQTNNSTIISLVFEGEGKIHIQRKVEVSVLNLVSLPGWVDGLTDLTDHELSSLLSQFSIRFIQYIGKER